MKRRTDRAIAISAVAAVAIVPTAILMVVKTGGDSPTDAAALPPSAAMAQRDPANPNGAASATVTPGTPGAPGAAPGASARPGARTPASGGAAHGLPTAPPQPGPSLHSFTRKTDLKVTVGSGGDYQQATETASFTLWPKFAMTATGVTQTMKGGELSKVTQKVIVQGSTLKGYDGQKWTRSTLTPAQLGSLQNGSDPQQFTFMIGTLPGMTASEPDAAGLTRFTAQALMGGVYSLLPQDAVAAFRKWVPDDTGCGLDLLADGEARPTTIGLSAQGPAAGLSGSMTFGSYR
ncbi:hypothetical protein BKA00_004842 [Actinomadura coerulea]|uniref:LppX_LprAFG lipoprotein n=1 Tax=Actinomadura coerulea TaxID=46159 RepID=A0A7X0G203_9ACTN|nr:hypothetical protein [Actinomadura coerulea]MBB6397928.1 hypothetical protein [Actinomadura coerulea]GGQ33424.1 hypothetical protein GCM10010187_58120 [Actinomadura coerulea]